MNTSQISKRDLSLSYSCNKLHIADMVHIICVEIYSILVIKHFSIHCFIRIWWNIQPVWEMSLSVILFFILFQRIIIILPGVSQYIHLAYLFSTTYTTQILCTYYLTSLQYNHQNKYLDFPRYKKGMQTQFAACLRYPYVFNLLYCKSANFSIKSNLSGCRWCPQIVLPIISIYSSTIAMFTMTLPLMFLTALAS